MLGRAARHAPEGSPLRADLREIGEIAQTALDNVRGLSQTLHPSILEELGLESTIDWYLSTVEKQLGHRTSRTSAPATPCRSTPRPAIHVYRVLQEALEQRRAALRRRPRRSVRLRFERSRTASSRSRITARGSTPARRGAGSAWSPCASGPSCVGGTLEFLPPGEGGTLVRSCAVPDRRRRQSGMTGRRSPSCSPTITRSCGAASAACSRTTRRSRSSARRATARKRSAWPRELEAARHRHGRRDAGHERAGRHARDPRAAPPDAAILMLSMHSEETLVRQALDAGARGYVLKNALDLDLAAAVKRVAAGETVLDPAVARAGAARRRAATGSRRASSRCCS